MGLTGHRSCDTVIVLFFFLPTEERGKKYLVFESHREMNTNKSHSNHPDTKPASETLMNMEFSKVL